VGIHKVHAGAWSEASVMQDFTDNRGCDRYDAMVIDKDVVGR
jgi:hypothetical protein